jgi:hypothetical protein
MSPRHFLRQLLDGLLILPVLLIACGCGAGDKKKAEEPPPDLSAPVTIDPWQAWEEYGENVLQADAKYKGKAVLIEQAAGITAL